MTTTWMADQIVYEIFPDRFAIGAPHTSESKLALPVYQQPRYERRRWKDLPVQPPRGRDFFGGDLRGVIDRLDHLTELGITCLYLTPIFCAPSNHKYDTTDFFQVDPMFGDEPTLRRLADALHAHGMRLVLDAVFNHISDQHPWCREHPEWLAGTYWRGFGHMPELALERVDVREMLFSVIEKWNALGVDGWRFDVAVDVGLPFLQALRERFPQQVFIGEVMSHPAGWCGPTAFSGVMNYEFRDAVLGWLAGEVSDRQVQRVLSAEFTGRWDSWNMLASHDTPRLRHVLGEEAARRLAWVMQFTLPGVPLIYYGEEIGMDGGPDPDCRRPMIWDAGRWDRSLHEFIRTLARLRRERAELRQGRLVMLEADGLVFLRATDKPHEVALVALNPYRRALRQRVFTPHPHLYHALPLRNTLVPHDTIKMEAGNVRLELPPQSAAIYLPADEMEHYRFFKPRNQTQVGW